MKEWKVRQDIYHKTNQVFSDSCLKNKDITVVVNYDVEDGRTLVDDIVEYFHTNPKILKYPAKSYFVAIVYALCISNAFNENFFELLQDPDLLYGNDPYFKPYDSSTKGIYDEVLEKVEPINLHKGQCPCVVAYFNEEFLLEKEYL